MPDFAYERVAAGQAMPGMFVVRPSLALATVIDELALIVEASESAEWDRKVVYLPLR